MIQNITLIFDIGKTNKKLYLLDEKLQEIHQEYRRFDEIKDSDGYPCDDLQAISNWIRNSVNELFDSGKYDIRRINFSTYGASMVQLDKNGQVIGPFYNYLKPFPDDLKAKFFDQYHGEANFSLITASPSMGFLNSGLQLYYLKYREPEIFKQIDKCLHFPQYLSYLFTNQLRSEYTSIGCHTGLWDYRRSEYAEWVKEEGLESLLPPAYDASETMTVSIKGKDVLVGIGVHDSSAALIPYVKSSRNPFVLISTGTWSICLNPFNEGQLSKGELSRDCLNFMSATGHSVKASRLFLGQELREQAMKLGEYFGVEYHRYKTVPYNPDFVPLKSDQGQLLFNYKHLDVQKFGFKSPNSEDLAQFNDFDHAYHQLMHEMTDLQICTLELAIGNSEVKEIFIDGGFADNVIFTQMLANKLPDLKVQSTEFALGSSLGAAVLVNSDRSLENIYESYKTRVHHPDTV